MTPGPCPLEDYEQEQLARYLDFLRLRWLHVPNMGKRHPRFAAKMARQGLKAGAPDILIFTLSDRLVAQGDVNGVAIELKRIRGGQATSKQKEWLAGLQGCGWQAAICRGHAAAIDWLRALGYG